MSAPAVGFVVASFGGSAANPSIVQTQSNALGLFSGFAELSGLKLDSFRLSDDAGFLGRTAMPGQLLVAPGNGWVFPYIYTVAASGTITIPASGMSAAAQVVLAQNWFTNTTPGQTPPTISIRSDVLASTGSSVALAAGATYPWSMVCSLTGSDYSLTQPYNVSIVPQPFSPAFLGAGAVVNINGTKINASGQAISDAGRRAILQLSLGVQFSGSVSGSDFFQASLTQFELQFTIQQPNLQLVR